MGSLAAFFAGINSGGMANHRKDGSCVGKNGDVQPAGIFIPADQRRKCNMPASMKSGAPFAEV